MADKVNIAGTTSGDNVQLTNSILATYSDEILHTAQPLMRFESVAHKKTELQQTPGKEIKVLKYAALTGDSALAETDRLESKNLSNSVISITVQEHAQAVQSTEFLLRTSFTDIMSQTSIALGRNYALNRERLIRDALLASANVKYSQAAGVATSRANLVAGSTFDLDLVRDGIEFLATKKAPKIDGDSYVCFVHPHQATQLRKTGDWTNVANYADPDRMLNGEIGRIDDVRFVETTLVPYIKIGTQDIWEDGADSGKNTAVAANAATNVYRSILVGDYAVAIADALPVEMRDDGVDNYGRFRSLAWYAIMGAGLIESDHCLVLETS